MAMPFSTFSAVRTPSSDRPSSTSVMATAGCMPTTTVVASSTRAMPEMLASMRPTNESTISRAEMSISTPLAPVRSICEDRSSCSARATWSCRSTWMVTSRALPIFRIGMRSTSDLVAADDVAGLLHGQLKRIGQGGLGGDALQVDAQVHDGLRDLRADAADDAFGAHQADGADGLQQVLGHECVHRGDAGDVDDGQVGAGFDDALQQRLHDELRAGGIQRADHGHGEDAFPELDHRRGELQQFLLLALDDLFAGAL